jgi:predicted RNA-binding protein Jag
MSEEQTVTIEGYTVAEAVQKAAAELGIEASLVRFDLDKSHFKNAEGRTVPRDTVKIIARAMDATVVAGAHAARDYIRGLLEKMEVEGTVTVTDDGGKRATVRIDSPRAAHLVGRRGVTLHAIQDLLVATMAKGEHSDWAVRLDVEGGRDEERGDRDDRGRDRDDRDDRGRGRDRDDRRGRGRDRDRDRGGRGGGRSKQDVERLKELARGLAQRALEQKKNIKIRKELNSYERRIVHVELQDMDGVSTRSVGDGAVKHVVIEVEGGEE